MQEATCFVATSYVVVRIQACRPRSDRRPHACAGVDRLDRRFLVTAMWR